MPTAARRTDGGYVMEALLPAALLEGFAPEAGRRLGLNLNLTVPQETGRGEVYWPRAKADGAPDRPHLWGTIELK